MVRSLLLWAALATALTCPAQWTYEWAVQSTSTNTEQATNCAVAGNGTVAVTGFFNNDLRLEDYVGTGAPGNGTKGFVAVYSAGGALQWVRVTSGWHPSGASCQLWDVAFDAEGNVLVVGQFGDSLLLDGTKVLTTPVEGMEGARVFSALKFSATGTLLWAAAEVVEGYTGFSQAIAVDPVGDVYLTGQGGYQYGHLVKLSGATGATLWHQEPNGAGAAIMDVACDAGGNVYITGQAGNEFVMGGLTCPYNNALGAGSTPVFVGKFTSNGDAVWYYVPDQTGSGYFGFPEGNIAVDHEGNVFVETRKRIRINGLTMNDGNGSDHALFCLTTDGAVQWARPVNLTGQLAINDIRCNSLGDVLLLGQSYGTSMDLVDTTITPSLANFNVFLARYGAGDGALEELLLNGPAVTDAMGLGLDEQDVPVIAGTFSGDVTMGTQALTGSWNVFVTRLGRSTGIAEQVAAPSLTVLSDAAARHFTVVLPTAHAWDLQVLDAAGRVLLRHTDQRTLQELDASGWAAGVYQIRARGGNDLMTARIVVP
jgi:hypothetical protein